MGVSVCFHRFGPESETRSDEEVAEWERQQAKLNQDYESPWLSALVTFSGFVAAFIGSVAVLFLAVHLARGTGWLPYALMLAGLVGAHLCLRAVRYQKRRRARRLAGEDHGEVTRQAARVQHEDAATGPPTDDCRPTDPS